MKKSFVSVCVALVALPLMAVVGTASPASAAPNCGNYPPGKPFGIRNSPDPRTSSGSVVAVTVPKNGNITLSARLFRNGQPCPQTPVYFYFHGPTDFQMIKGTRTATYHYSQSPAYTDGQGLAKITVKVINDFRWFVNYNVPVTYPVQSVSSTQGARTDGQSLVKYAR